MASQAMAIPLRAIIAEPETALTVLVADPDPRNAGAYVRLIGDLGYRHLTVVSASAALDCLDADPSIQVLITDLALPSIGGFALIEEGRRRRGVSKPFVAIVLASEITAEVAMAGIRHQVADILPNNGSAEGYAAALTRSIGNFQGLYGLGDRTTDLSQQLNRIVCLLEGQRDEGLIQPGPGLAEIGSTLSAIITCRSLRARHLPGEMFADPAWDILLDLVRAELAGEHVSVSSVCIAASVPMSTALRWVKQMTDAGLLTRWTDPRDRRRDLICLSDTASANMKRYLASAYGILRKIGSRI